VAFFVCLSAFLPNLTFPVYLLFSCDLQAADKVNCFHPSALLGRKAHNQS